MEAHEDDLMIVAQRRAQTQRGRNRAGEDGLDEVEEETERWREEAKQTVKRE